MAETGKKVEVRYGAFACRVEGFDDPVVPLREVLSLMQRMIAETPALADHRAALDDAQVARIGDALAAGRAAEDATPGIIVIRSGEPAGSDIDDAQILPPREARAEATAWHPPAEQPASEPEPRDAAGPGGGLEDRAAPRPADAGRHPSAALYAAPAAAAAEAAFAASVAAAAAMPGDEAGSQSPLAVEPEDAATPAALYAAPAAGVADTAFASRVAAPAPPADLDDDAGDPDLPWADEAAGERAQSAPTEPGRPEPSEAPSGQAEPGIASSDADHAGDALRHGRPPGGPGDGWAPWGARQPGAAETEAPFPSFSLADQANGGYETAPLREFREPASRYDEPEGESDSGFNIFAPPAPDPDPAIARPPDGVPPGADGPAHPVATLRGEAGPVAAADDHAHAVPETASHAPPEAKLAPAAPFAASGDAPEGALDGAAGDWPDGEDATHGIDETDDDVGADPPGSAENRLAALITRYQNGLREHAASRLAPDPMAGTLSAAELAERAGATEVETLLAASAAWLTLADGRGQFTRREVMEVFETLPGNHPRTLEARIKGFGTLVRSGALQLVDDGAFSLAPRERARFQALIDQG